MKIEQEQILRNFLSGYRGPALSFMEVCGTHTEKIAAYGIRDLLSPDIHLLTGPGCPVCVTVSAYIDRLIELAFAADTTVVTFGDLLRVPGSSYSLAEAKARGASVEFVYGPRDLLPKARQNPDHLFVFAAVGFETTIPIYVALLEELSVERIENVKLLTALKTMPAAIDWVLANSDRLDGLLAPGNVSVITGSNYFEKLAEKWQKPFVIGGFSATELILALSCLLASTGQGVVKNMYPSVVTASGNRAAQTGIRACFESGPAAWRGFGLIAESGLYLSTKWQKYDAGSRHLLEDIAYNSACSCGAVLTGQLSPEACPLFGSSCRPDCPQGACMISGEGACFNYWRNR